MDVHEAMALPGPSSLRSNLANWGALPAFAPMCPHAVLLALRSLLRSTAEARHNHTVVPSPPQQPKSTSARVRRSNSRHALAAGTSTTAVAPSAAAAAQEPTTWVSPYCPQDGVHWRVRVHRARRRAMLVVWTVIALRRGLRRRQRPHRVDSFSFVIPQALGQDVGRFVAEQQGHAEVAVRAMGLCDALQALMAAEECAAAGGAFAAAVVARLGAAANAR